MEGPQLLQNSSALTVLTSILTLSISIAAPAEAQKPSWAEAADKIIAEVSTPGEPGGAVGVVVEGELVYSRGFGYANLDHQVANTPDTVFDIASCAKQFTAASALLLAEDGKLDLEEA